MKLNEMMEEFLPRKDYSNFERVANWALQLANGNPQTAKQIADNFHKKVLEIIDEKSLNKTRMINRGPEQRHPSAEEVPGYSSESRPTSTFNRYA